MHKRIDIQGLRAIAVIGVISFHTENFKIAGGFLGVDVFFAVSGYLITSLLLREATQTGRINLRQFFSRRFFRLAPTLGAVLVVVAIAAVFLMSPLEPLNTTLITGISSMFAIANLYISSSNSNYFASDSTLNPFLHLWSLSVEEQFYLLFPLALSLLLLVGKGGRTTFLARARNFILATVILGLVFMFVRNVESFQFLERAIGIDYYSTVPRIWEIAAGALVATMPENKLIAFRKSAIVAPVSLGLLIVAFTYISDKNTIPGPVLTLPILATCALLASRSQASKRLMGSKIFQWVGDRSYSLYLWHWPLLVFTAQFANGLISEIVAILVTLALSECSYRFIERPFTEYGKQQISNQTERNRKMFKISASTVSALVVLLVVQSSILAPAAIAGIGEQYRGDLGHDVFHSYVDKKFESCSRADLLTAAEVWNGILRCHRNATSDNSVQVALYGDSHAEHLFPGLARELPDVDMGYYIRGEAPSLDGSDENKIYVNHILKTSSIKTVIISAFWLDRGFDMKSLSELTRAIFTSGKRVILLNDVPSFDFDPYECKYKKAIVIPTRCSDATQQKSPELLRLLEKIDSFSRAFPKAVVLDTRSIFCNEGECSMTLGSKLMFRDNNHLNLLGSEEIAKRISAAVKASLIE